MHVDGSLIDADASRDSVVKADPETIARIRAAFGAQERKLDETKPPSARCETNRKVVSTTDPDVPYIAKGPRSGTARPRYKHHCMVDDRCGVITAVETTAGDVAEPSQLEPLLVQHEMNTSREVTASVADRQYGTVETYCAHIEQGVRPHMSPMMAADHKSDGLFTKEDFRYDETADVYICPVGHRLKPRRFHQRREMTDYVADKKVCAKCPIRSECTRSKTGRPLRDTGRRKSSRWRTPLRGCPRRARIGIAAATRWKAALRTPPTDITSSVHAGADCGVNESRTGSSPQCRTSCYYAGRLRCYE